MVRQHGACRGDKTDHSRGASDRISAATISSLGWDVVNPEASCFAWSAVWRELGDAAEDEAWEEFHRAAMAVGRTEQRAERRGRERENMVGWVG